MKKITLLKSLLVVMALSLFSFSAVAEEVTATLTFDNTSKRTVGTTAQQVWVENGITFTNDKAASSSNVNTSYHNPIRCYASSSITIAVADGYEITKIVATCSSSDYASALKNSVGGEATSSGSTCTINLSTQAQTYIVSKLSAQVRINSITVTMEETGGVVLPSLEAPIFSEESKRFSAPFDLTITAAEGATVKYTLNDSEEELTYSNAISITETTKVTAWAEQEGYKNSSKVSATYTYVPEGTSIYEYIFTEKLFTSTNEVQELNGVEWTLAVEGTTYCDTYDASKGQQIGKSAEPATSIQLSTNEIAGKITKIIVNTSGASSIDAQFAVSVNDVVYGESVKLTNVATEYTFTGVESGKILLKWTNSSEKAIYIKSIYIEYITSDDEVEATAIALDQTTLALDQYREAQLTATLTPAEAVAAIVWTSSNEEVATVVNGLVAAVGVGEATITATAGELTATCVVTVSEAQMLTCAQAAEYALSVSGNNVNYEGGQYVVSGYVTKIATEYSEQYKNISVWVADTKDGGEVLQLYRAKLVDEVIPVVGDSVVAVGYLTKYNTTPEMAAGCVCRVVENGGVGTDVDNLNTATIYTLGRTIVAEGEIQIFSITGQNVTDMNGNLQKGVYVVKSANSACKVVVK